MKKDDDIESVPAEGQAWLGDWEARLRSRLAALGFHRLEELAAAHPQYSIDQLAEHLSVDQARRINLADVAAIQVAELWLAEAAAIGPAAVELMARRILLGELAESLPEGFPDWRSAIEEYRKRRSIESPVWKLIECFSALSDCMGEEHRMQCDRVYESLMQRAERGEIPAGWQPGDPADPILLDAFREGWRQLDQGS